MHDVPQHPSVLRLVEPGLHLRDRRDLTAVEGQQQVANRESGAAAGTGIRDFAGHHIGALLAPQHAVFGFALPGLHERYVDDRQAHQGEGDGNRERHAQQGSQAE